MDNYYLKSREKFFKHHIKNIVKPILTDKNLKRYIKILCLAFYFAPKFTVKVLLKNKDMNI